VQRRTMPRSFLVKKVKLDDFSSADLERHYGSSRTDLSLRFHEKGKAVRISDFYRHAQCLYFIAWYSMCRLY
jgi:hypothetical protein